MKRIGQYLKGTIDKGLSLDPSDDLSLGCLPDADFAGLWSHKTLKVIIAYEVTHAMLLPCQIVQCYG